MADTLDDIAAVSKRTDSFYCTPTDGDPFLAVFAPSAANPSEIIMYPAGLPSRKNGGVYTVDLDDGTASFSEKAFVSITSDETATGPCRPFDDEINDFMRALSVADPEGLAGAAGAKIREESRAKVAALQDEIMGLKTTLASRIEQNQANLSEASAKFAREVAAMAEVNPLNGEVIRLKGDKERQKRENDKLKRRICELDPKTTFSVCQP